jgi:hypothetical protein
LRVFSLILGLHKKEGFIIIDLKERAQLLERPNLNFKLLKVQESKYMRTSGYVHICVQARSENRGRTAQTVKKDLNPQRKGQKRERERERERERGGGGGWGGGGGCQEIKKMQELINFGWRGRGGLGGVRGT